MAAKTVIVIGSEGHSGVETVPWSAEKMPNISDYDAVVIDTTSLASLLQKANDDIVEERAKVLRRIQRNLRFMQGRLLCTLDSRGDVFAICSEEVGMRIVSTSQSSYIDNYRWSPILIETEKEEGETIAVKDKAFARYFQFVKGWSFCLKIPEDLDTIDGFYENNYVEPQIGVIAENRYNKPLALIFIYRLHTSREWGPALRALASSGDEAMAAYERGIIRTSDRMVLLPPPTEIDTKEAINILLEEFFGIHQLTPPPEWVAKEYVPGEFELEGLIRSKREEIDRLQAEIGDLDRRKSEKSQFKQLLYETGTPLENICKLTIRKLGAETDDSVEDFILRNGGREAVVEVKGREAVIERKDGDQLARNMRSYAAKKDVAEVKGVLLGNPWRLLPLEGRDEKEAFAQHLVSDAKRDNIALVTTVDLFRAYSAVLKGSVSNEDVIERFFSGVGITNLLGKV